MLRERRRVPRMCATELLCGFTPGGLPRGSTSTRNTEKRFEESFGDMAKTSFVVLGVDAEDFVVGAVGSAAGDPTLESSFECTVTVRGKPLTVELIAPGVHAHSAIVDKVCLPHGICTGVKYSCVLLGEDGPLALHQALRAVDGFVIMLDTTSGAARFVFVSAARAHGA